jgi:paraquat-inducible protein A
MSASVARFLAAPSFAADLPVRTGRRLHECPDCGLFQIVPPLYPAERASCLRCSAVLRQTRHDPLARALALNLAALSLFGVGIVTLAAAGHRR